MPGENQTPVTSHWQTLSHNIVSSIPLHQRLNRFWSEKRCRNSTFTLGSKKVSSLLLLTHTWWCENITASPCVDTGYCNSFYFCLWLYNYWEYVIECVFAVEGHIILKIWSILRIKNNSSCGSLSTSNIEYGDIMIGFFSTLHIFPGKFW